MDPQKLVEHFSMSPHPEGGFFAETYRSQGAIPADALPGFGGTRNFSTGILFLLWAGPWLRDLILRILKWPIPTFWGRPSPTPPGWYVNSVRVRGR